MFVLSFDPGNTTGWAYQNQDSLLEFGNLYSTSTDKKSINNDFVKLLSTWDLDEKPVDHVVIEDYVILNNKAMSHSGSRVIAIQVIGFIKAWCMMKDIPFTMYKANMKPIQKKLTQIDIKGSHAETHFVDAWIHGRYWLIKNGYAKSALQMEMEKKIGKV